MRKIKDNKVILVVILIAILLRFYGIDHGFPYIFHPDEPATIRSGLGIRFNINPGHFDWPHLYFYINYFVFYAFAFLRDTLGKWGYKEYLSTLFPLLWNDKLIFYLLSRILTALVGIFSIIPVYLSGKELFNKRVGIISSLALALIPLHVIYSHLALPDIPMVFFLCWYIYYVSKIYSKPSLKNYIFAGLFLGLSASTKYNGGVAVIYILLVFLFTQKINLQSLKKIVIAGISSILGFLIGTPFALIDFDTFIRSDEPVGAMWQFTNTGSVSFSTRVNAFLNYFTPPWARDYGYVVMYVFLVGLLYLCILGIYRVLKCRGRSNLFNLLSDFKKSIYSRILSLYIPAIYFIFLISGFVKNRSHYYLIAYPFVILVFAYFIDKVIIFLDKSNYFNKNLKRLLILLFSLIVFIPILLSCFRDISKLINKRTGPAVGGMIDGYMQEIR